MVYLESAHYKATFTLTRVQVHVTHMSEVLTSGAFTVNRKNTNTCKVDIKKTGVVPPVSCNKFIPLSPVCC